MDFGDDSSADQSFDRSALSPHGTASAGTPGDGSDVILRDGKVAAALDEPDAAGHLHVVDDELGAYTAVLMRRWRAHLAVEFAVCALPLPDLFVVS